jgi:hypothetical protein
VRVLSENSVNDAAGARQRSAPLAPERAVDEQGAEREQRQVERGHHRGRRQDQAAERGVVELVGDRPPERLRAAAVEQRPHALEQRAVEEVEILRHRLAPRRAAHRDRERQHREHARPRPRVAEAPRRRQVRTHRRLADPGRPARAASRAVRAHQMVTRTSSPRYMASPGLMPNAA